LFGSAKVEVFLFSINENTPFLVYNKGIGKENVVLAAVFSIIWVDFIGI